MSVSLLSQRSEQISEQRNQLRADQADPATGHELFDTLGLCSGVVIAVAFQKVYYAPRTQARAQRRDQRLKNTDCRTEKCHIITFTAFAALSVVGCKEKEDQRHG